MENAEKIEKMTFKDYYQSLDEERKKAVRDQFLVASGISYPTFYSKLTRYLQPIITQYFIDNKSEIWLLFLIAHSKR